MTTPDIPDDFTELVDFRPDRVDLVGKGANGVPRFLIAKQSADAGVLDAEFVRSLVEKSEPDDDRRRRVEAPNGVVLSGSPAAMAAFIHAANVRKAEESDPARSGAAAIEAYAAAVDAHAGVAKAAAEYEAVVKAKYNAADLKRMAGDGEAMEDGSYPIGDEEDLTAAVRAVGRGGADHDAIRRHVIKRAKALGKTGAIPDNWNSDGSLKGDVAKEADVPDTVTKDMMSAAGDAVELDDGIDGLDPTVPLAAPDEMAPGDPTQPGSPAWESIDAATAQKWTSIAARLSNVLCILAEREMLEAAGADPSDAENAFDLEDAKCAVEYAIERLAVFAAGEQAEADLAGAEMELIGKALARVETAPLETIEGFAAVRKSGRVLSAANESRIREATNSLTAVLASLPSAPTAPEPVAKEAAMPAETTTVTEPPATDAGRMQAKVSAVIKAAQTPAEPASPADGDVAKGSAEDQARNAGPVGSGASTTGLGSPRITGPAESLPADGPQERLAGDTGRQVVKAALPVAVWDVRRALLGLIRPDLIVEKADAAEPKVAMQAVFDEEGNLVGIVDPADITPVAGAGGSSAETAEPGPAAAAAPAADDMTPQPAGDAGIAADAVGKQAADQNVITTSPEVLDSIIAKAVAAAVGAAVPAQEVVAKQAADLAGALAEVDLLKARLVVVEKQPAMPGVFTHGQTPPEGARPLPPGTQLRGQDQQGGQDVSVAKAAELREQLYKGSGPEQAKAFHELEGMAIARLQRIRANGPQSPAVAAA